MSPAPDAPVELSFGAAYERLQEVSTELSADASMPPERLIALLREGKGLERALRDHLDRIEQEVRAIDEGEGATPFRIVDGPPVGADAQRSGVPRGAAPEAAPVRPAPPTTPAPDVPAAARPAPDGPGRAVPAAEGAAGDGRAGGAAPDGTAPAAPAPDAPPTLGFLGADDDIPF